jgi:signal transduction histidine kinase
MKKRFLVLLAILVALFSLTAVLVSQFAVKRSMEKLIMERAANRLSIIIWGFGATSLDVDLYSYVEFDYEVLSVRKDGFPVFQYGTARLDLESPGTRKLERGYGAYQYTLYVDFEAELDKYLGPVRSVIRITAVVYGLLFAAFGWLFIGMVADPIAALAGAMTKITSRNLRVRIPAPKRKDEVGQLITVFNAMLDDLAGTYERQAQFVEDMIHDIATPVQILEGYRQLIARHGKAGGLVDEFLSVSEIQLRRLRDMTFSLKTAIAAERVRRVERADAATITARNVAYYSELHPEVRFVSEIGEGLSLPVAPEDLERIEHILIDNALKYGREGGIIEVSLAPGELRVRDHGAGIAEEDRASVFERYRRGSGASGRSEGAGIGLAILKRFSEEYGFRIELESRPGEGCAFTLSFQDCPPAL